MSSDVRNHRLFSPNRRPLLISALLVLLTSVPTMIVVAAGSATLESAPSARAPVVADPQPGPAVVGSGPTSGLHASGPAGRHSLGAVPTAPQPPLRPRATERSPQGSGGSGGGSGTSSGAPGRPGPSREASPPSTETPIQDRAWPGWDDKIKESVSIRVGRSDISGRPIRRSGVYRPARVFELRVTTAHAVTKGLQGHIAQPAVQPAVTRPVTGWWSSARRRASVTAWS